MADFYSGKVFDIFHDQNQSLTVVAIEKRK